MEQQSLIVSALLLGMLAFAVWWHLRENRQIAQYLERKKIDEASAEWLMRFAWSRTIQLLATCAFGIIIIVSYDWKLSDANEKISEFSKRLEQVQAKAVEAVRAAQQQAPAAPAQVAAAAATPAPAAAPVAAAQPQAATAAVAAPQAAQAAVAAQPAQQPAPAANLPRQGIPPEVEASISAAFAPPAPPAVAQPVTLVPQDGGSDTDAIANMPASEGSDADASAPAQAAVRAVQTVDPATAPTLEQVYNPEREQGAEGDDQSSMDDIKKRYEDILVIYMFLKQCNRIESADYNVITSALAQEMASVNAPGRLQADIVNSAKGSYQEIYSQSPCDGTGINKLVRQYHQYIEVLQKNFPPE